MQISKEKGDFEAIWQLIEKSFPPDELRKRDDFIALSDNKLFHAFTERRKDEIIAFIGVWIFEGFAFIEYFAVSEQFRCKGIGTAMLAQLFENVRLPICLEAEPPKCGGLAQRRIEFYRRSGFALNSFDYFQPAYSDDKKPLPLLIMSRPHALCDSEFRNYKKTIYEKVYNKKHR